MQQTRFDEILGGFSRVRIAVVGDLFLDRIFYINRDWDEISVETGLAAYQVCRRSCVPGAAGVITNNLCSLRAGPRWGVGITGNDGEAFDLCKALENTGCSTRYMVAQEGRFTPTYTKVFFERPDGLEETHRIDTKNRSRMAPENEDRVIANLLELEKQVDAFVCLEQLADGDCGVFTDRVIETLRQISLRGKARVVVDSRFHIAKFRDMIVKCNDNEILRAAGIVAELDGPFDRERVARVEKAMRSLQQNPKFPMFVSCGADGIRVLENDRICTVPACRVEGPVDICGAGDSALTGIACALCAGATLSEAALLGNLVASIIVQQIGVTGTATPEQLRARFAEYQQQRSK